MMQQRGSRADKAFEFASTSSDLPYVPVIQLLVLWRVSAGVACTTAPGRTTTILLETTRAIPPG